MDFNKLYNCDVMEILKKTPDNTFDMVFGDPDYNVGINYDGAVYTQKWDEYVDWYCKLTKECMRILKPTGNLFMMNYSKQNAYLRVKCLDAIAYDVQDYSWIYNTSMGATPRRFTTAHRSILHATKSHDNHFYKEQVAVPFLNPSDKRIKAKIEDGSAGKMPFSWFYFDNVKNVSKEKTFHPCQLPKKLVEMFIKSCTKEGDSVFIPFGGSGTEVVLCNEMKRKWVSCELHKPYFDMINARLANDGAIPDECRLSTRKDGVYSPRLF